MPEDAIRGKVALSDAIGALRDELIRAWWDGRDRTLRFKPSPVELTLQLAVTGTGKGSAGINWWVLELGGEYSRESVATQTIKVVLDPIIFDENGEPLAQTLIEAQDAADQKPEPPAQL